MPTGIEGWDTGISWGRKFWEKVFVMCWGWIQRGNGDWSRFPDTEVGIWRWSLDLWAIRVCLQPVCCPGRGCPWFIRGCCWVKILHKAKSEGRKVKGIALWTVVREAGLRCSPAELGIGSGVTERKRGSVGSLPSFLAGVDCGLAGDACLSWGLG